MEGMMSFTRACQLTKETGKPSVEGRILSFNKPYVVDGLTETIPDNVEIDVAKDIKCLIGHDQGSCISESDNIELERKHDGLYFKLKKLPDKIKQMIKGISSCSAGFFARPILTEGNRSFNRMHLHEISLTPTPAYNDAYIHVRKKPEKQLKPPELYI